MLTVGISCTPKFAYLAVAEDGEIVASEVERFQVAAQHESSAELLRTRDDARRILRALGVERVGLLAPEEKARRAPSYQELVPRIALETMIRVGAVEEGLEVELLSRPTVRARLGIAQTGSLKSQVEGAISTPVGKYWGEGRCLAALAALAAERGPR